MPNDLSRAFVVDMGNDMTKRTFLAHRLLKKPDDVDISIQNSLEGLTDDIDEK